MQLSGSEPAYRARQSRAAGGIHPPIWALGGLVVLTFVSLHVLVHQRSNDFADLRHSSRDMIHDWRRLDRCMMGSHLEGLLLGLPLGPHCRAQPACPLSRGHACTRLLSRGAL